jgi:hypothetical protein
VGTESGDVTRRDALGIISATAAAGLGVGALSGWNKARDYQGIPDSLSGNSKLETYIEENYRRDEFDSAAYDALVDMRFVEGERFAGEHVQELRDIFSDLGINLAFLEREEKIDEGEFTDMYGPSTDDILDTEDSLYDETVDEVMKDAAAQVFMVPGRETPYGEKLINGGELSYPDPEDLEKGDDLGANAVALGDRAAVAIDEYGLQPVLEREGPPDKKLYTVIHELGHIFGLGHTDDLDNVMFESNLRASRDPTFTSRQAEAMRENLV